jgi:teichuronic acid biosynthesis glycosyltransferase TuaG
VIANAMDRLVSEASGTSGAAAQVRHAENAPAVEVSVVVPAYNAQRHLPDTIASVLAQQDVAFELIVVDDCSSDATAQCVAEAAVRDPRVRYLRMPANSGGPAGPRNHGVQAARATWVALCDADDLWHPRKLRLQLDLALSSGANLVCSAIEDFADGETSALPTARMPAALPSHPLPYWQMLLKDRIATSSVLCRRDALLAGGGFNTARELIAVEDYDLWLRLMEQPGFQVLRIEVALVAYRRLASSLSASKWRHARKVMRVPRLAAQRRGWGWAFPLVAPLLWAGYGGMSVYWRVLKGRL